MGQQISAAAESVGPGAASAGAALPYSAAGAGMALNSGGVASQPMSQSQSGETSRGDSNHPSVSQQQQTGQQNKNWTAASFDSLRALPPLPKPPARSSTPSSSSGNSQEPGGGSSRAASGGGEQGDSQQGAEMELGKISIREAIDSFIERCLHNNNDGGASDNESSEESLGSHHSRATVGNIFALDSSSKRSPSSSCQSPSALPRDKDSGHATKREKGRASGSESRTSRDSGSSSSSPKPLLERGEAGRPSSRQERGEKTLLDRRDSNGDNSKDGKSSDGKYAMNTELVMKVDPSMMEEGEDTVLVIDCDAQEKDEKCSKGENGSPAREGDGKSPPVKPESVTPKMERSGDVHAKEEPSSEFVGTVGVKQESEPSTAATSGEKFLSDKSDDQSSKVISSPSHQPRGNLLMWELSKKPVAQSSSSCSETKAVRPAPFLPGPKHLQLIIDRVLDSTLNDSSDSPGGAGLKDEVPAEPEKKASTPKETDSKVEIIKVEEPMPMKSQDSKSNNKDNSDMSVLKEQMAQTQVPVCFKDHIEKVLLESFLSYEEEERKEALKKADTSDSGGPGSDSKGRESGSSEASMSKTISSPKNAISVQDIVDRVITQTEAINKNMTSPAVSDSRGSGQGEGRHSTSGTHDGSLLPSSTSISRSHTSSSVTTSAAMEGNYANSNYHQNHPHHPQHQQHGSSQPLSSQEKALQEAQRHVVLKEHQSSTTTGRKRGRPRRVSPSASNNSHAHRGNNLTDFRLNTLGPGHHYPDERSRAGHLAHHGPPPPTLDYNLHGSLSFGLPPGVSALLRPPSSASLMRQHHIEQQRQQQQVKDLHSQGLHGAPSGSAAYPPPTSRGHPREPGPHPMDMHPSRSHLPLHQQQHTSGCSTAGGGGSSINGGIKPPPPLILADSISPATRLVPVSHIPTKSCSCHSCVAHFSGSSSTSSAAHQGERNGSPAAQHGRLVQHQQSLHPGSSSSRHDGRDTSRSPHHPAGHTSHSHPVYGAAVPYSVSSPPSSSTSSRHTQPSSAKDYYSHAHFASRGGECLRPVVSMSNRGLPPQAIIPTFVAAQRQQLPRDVPQGHGSDMLATSVPSPNQPQHYSRDVSHPRYYESKSSSASSTVFPATSSTNSYQQYPPGSQPHAAPPSHHRYSQHHHQQQQQQQQQQQHSASSQHHKPMHIEHRYSSENESLRHHPDYITASASSSAVAAHYGYDQRSQQELSSGRSLTSHSSLGSSSSLSSLRAPASGPAVGGAARPAPDPVESDPDAPLDLSVKPSRKQEQNQQQQEGPSAESSGSHRTNTGSLSAAEAGMHHGRAYRRRSLDMSDGRSGQYKHSGEYREVMQASHQPHYLQTLENSVDRILPHHQRSPYQGQHHPQQQQQHPHPHPNLPSQSHHPPHLRASVSPHGPRSNPDPVHTGAPHHFEHQQERSAGYPTSSRAQQSPGQQRGYPPHHYPPSSSHSSSNNQPAGMYPHYPLTSTSPSMPQHPQSHPHYTQAPHQPPPSQHQYTSQLQHHSRAGSNSSISNNINSSHGPSTIPSPSSQNYYSRSPVLGRPQAVSPASSGPHHHHQKTLDSSPHQPYPHGGCPPPPPPQSNSPFQRPPSHSQEGDNSRPSPVNSSHPSAGPPPPLARRPSDTPSPDEEDLDAQGKLSISKHEPIQNIIGNHSPGDILYLICRLCRQTYGNLYGFRKHFRKEHGFEPKGEHTVVQTISATKNAMAHPATLDHMDGGRGISSGGYDKPSANQHPPHHSDNHSHSTHPYPPQHSHAKQKDSSKDMSRYYPTDHYSSEGGPPPKRSEVLKDQKLLECAECSQTFQLNDFGAYKRHCRQHSGGPGSGPFLCHDCHRCFAEPDQLQEHLNTHADFTPSVCGICMTPFSAPDYLAEHLKAAHGHSASGAGGNSSSVSTPAWDKGDNASGASIRQGMDRKAEYLPEGSQSSKSWGLSSKHPHPSAVSVQSSPGATASSTWSTSSSNSMGVPSSRRTMGEHAEPQHAVVHTPRDLQVEKLPADPAVMTASPDSSYVDEKSCADSQTSSTVSVGKAGINSSQNPADHVPGNLKQQDRDSDSSSNSPSLRSRDVSSMQTRSSPLARQSRDSSSGQSYNLTPQPLSSGKQTTAQSEPFKTATREDSESVSSDRCGSVESNSLSIEGSRTSSPAVDEPDFTYKHKKYSRYNRKRSTETTSMSGEPGIKSARSSSAESNAATSTPAASTSITNPSSCTAFSSPSVSHSGGKNEQNLSPVVTSSASNARDCESSTSSTCASLEDSGRSRSPSKYGNGNSGGSKRGDSELSHRDSQGKKSASEENHFSKDKDAKSFDASKKRKGEESGSSFEDKPGGKRWSGSGGGAGDCPGGESGKFKWERMTRSQMGKVSQSVSYSSSS